MFGSAGIAYVYLVYGMYDCLNVVTGPEGSAAALLIRAIEPTEGLDRMRLERARRTSERRRTPIDPRGRAAAVPDVRVASGPGLVGAALGLDRSWTGTDLCDPDAALRLEGPLGAVPSAEIRMTARIGVGYAGEPWASIPWRFAVAGHASVSGPRARR
jgi:DNA-3-methyladenine glycosylase